MPKEMFSAICEGRQLPAGMWQHARDAKGRSLLHAAMAYGRLDSMWILLKTCPALAAMPDFDMYLPEQFGTNDQAVYVCQHMRKKFFLYHSAL